MSTTLTRRKVLGSTAALAALSCTHSVHAATAAEPTPVVVTSLGPVRGSMEPGGVHAFKGMRYAAPPVGTLRWRPPQPAEPWTAVADATRFGAAAIQAGGQPDAPKDEVYSEDCLFLNVWTGGLDSARRPVMVWLHGGGFSVGAAGRPTYFGDHFARSGVVLVSINHRLNVFGYTQLPDSWGPAYESSGVAGLLDIVQALQWVQDNIARFGGDPANVTLFGESGGGAKVSNLLGMPATKGLIHKAIIQSGAALDAAPRPYAQALGQALTDRLNVRAGDTAALSALDTGRIFAEQTAAVAMVEHRARKGFLTDGFVPSVGGRALPRGAFTPDAPEMAADIPLMLGTNKDEMTLFLAGSPIVNQSQADFETGVREAYPAQSDRLIPALRAAYPNESPGYLSIALATVKTFWLDSVVLAQRKAQHRAPVWMYRMDWGSPVRGGRLKAAHAMELSFVFGTQDNVRDFVGPGSGPDRMAAQMHSAWVAFAKHGNPASSLLPEWPRYESGYRKTMIFNLESHVEADPMGSIRQLLIP